MFSIGIPAYKSLYLEACIRSVLSQTYGDFELIVLNDASPHPVEEIVKRFDDPRIRYEVNARNVGVEHVVDNWNACLAKASRPHFLLLGDDDMLAPRCLEAFAELSARHPDRDVFHCRSLVVDCDGKPLLPTYSWPEHETVYESMWHRLRGLRMQYVSDFLYRTDKLRAVGGYYKLPAAWASDDVTAYLVGEVGGIVHTQETLLFYRSNEHSITKTMHHRMKVEALNLYADWIRDFLAKPPRQPSDELVHGLLTAEYRMMIQYKKIDVLVHAVRRNGIRVLLDWLCNTAAYRMSLVETCGALVRGYLDLFRARS